MKLGNSLVAVVLIIATAGAVSAEWKYSETKDAMSDSRYARVFADGDTGAIGIKCDAPGPNSLYLHYVSKEYLGGSGGSSASRDLLYRFDEDAPVTSYWRYDGRGAIMTNDKQVWAFIARLERAKKLAIRATTYQYSQVTTIIDVTDSAPQIAKVIEACQAARPA